MDTIRALTLTGSQNGGRSRPQSMEKAVEDFRQLRDNKQAARLERMRQVVAHFRKVGRLLPSRTTDRRVPKERLAEMARCAQQFEALTQRLRRKRPADFSIFEMFRASGDELTHSRVLAWLMDPLETHHEGPLFLSAFAELIGLDIALEELRRCQVRTEVTHDESRIDLMLYCVGGFLIFVENKIWSSEGDSQIDREFRDMRRVGRAISVPPDRQFAVFLTPFGRPPVSGDHSNWISISYEDIANCFGRILGDIDDTKVRVLVADWLETVVEWS